MSDPFMWRDENTGYLADPAGLGAPFTAAAIVAVTTGAATVETSIAGLFPLGANPSGSMVVRIANVGTNPALYAFDVAGQSANHTDNTNMLEIIPNWIEYRRVDRGQVSLYTRQVTGPNTLQVAVLS
jgi:hypothetical protein